jgi:hypothetical protein
MDAVHPGAFPDVFTDLGRLESVICLAMIRIRPVFPREGHVEDGHGPGSRSLFFFPVRATFFFKYLFYGFVYDFFGVC